jgi:2-oxoglutarate dehydrogenase complex dehydrogenase (E1) component-like enzyme
VSATGSNTPANHFGGSFGPNEWLVDEMYERFLADPNSVDAAWGEFFSDYTPNSNLNGNSNGTSNGKVIPLWTMHLRVEIHRCQRKLLIPHRYKFR